MRRGAMDRIISTGPTDRRAPWHRRSTAADRFTKVCGSQHDRATSTEAIINIEQAQDEIRAAYLGGAPGVFVSGLAWLIADAVWYLEGGLYAFIALAIGGMLIVPLSLLVARLHGAPSVPKGNPLNRLGFELTIPLFAGLLIAFGLLQISETFAFSAFATIVGARYFSFATLYRDRLYWLFGGSLFLIGTGFAVRADVVPVHVTLAVGVTELLFAALLFTRWNATLPRA